MKVRATVRLCLCVCAYAMSTPEPPRSKRQRNDASPSPRASEPARDVDPSVVSVLMPCRNAQPWLSACVRSVLTQRDVALELIVGDDGSTDGSREWLVALERAMASRQVRLSRPRLDDGEDGAKAFDEDTLTCENERMRSYTVEEVARDAEPRCSLRVLSIDRDEEESPSGQGLALNRCFRASVGAYIGEMESDDLRPPMAFAALKEALDAHDTWDAVTSKIELCGWERQGMRRFERFQNELLEPSELASNRFIEIPALRATALFRRSALVELRKKTHANALYRDIWPNPQGVVVDYASLDAKAPVLDGLPHRWWPVDSDFWHRWFHHDFVVAKISRNLYIWRQYSAQSTRTHNRCSLEQLRRCKAYFFVAAVLEGKFAPSISEIRVYGVGATLEAWKSAIQLEFAEQNGADETRVFSLPHKPGASRWSSKDASDSVLHVFAYGMAPARAKVRRAISRCFRGDDLRSFIHVFVA